MHLKLFSTILNFDFANAYDGFAYAPGISSLIYYTTFFFVVVVYFLLKLFGFCILKVSRFETS